MVSAPAPSSSESVLPALVPLADARRPRTTVYEAPERLPTEPCPTVGAEEYASYASGSTPIVIDNGSYSVRAGYSTMASPHLDTEAVVSKYRDRKSNRPILLAGNDAYIDATSRSNIKPICEEGVVCNWDVMENMLDYVFVKLGVDGEAVDHPLLMSEALCNPLWNRSIMSEILFEGYRVPSLCYGVDSLFSFYDSHSHLAPASQDGLVISSNHSSTTLVPFLSGTARIEHSRRLNWGGAQAGEFMLKLMQLKYPNFPSRMTTFQASELVKGHCQFALDYGEELRRLRDPKAIAEADRIIQFPYTLVETVEKTEEELAAQTEKRRLAGIRLQEQTAKMRSDKLAQKEADLTYFVSLLDNKAAYEATGEWERRVEKNGFDNEQELEGYVKKTQRQLQKARNKELGIEDDKEEPDFSLVDVPDHDLDEDGVKEKRKQKLMKAGLDARERVKAERDAEKERLAEERRKDEEARKTDPEKWLSDLRVQHDDVITRIKDRKKRKTQLSDRKSLAAQQRMKTIANLASDAATVKGNKRRKKANDDNFGADDADWAVYRDVAGADESADEDEERAELVDVERRLLEHDPDFTMDDTHERSTFRKQALLNSWLRGLSPQDPMSAYNPEDLELNSRLHLNVERVRVPEPLYQPLMAGVDQAGVLEVMQYILREFSQEEQKRLTRNIFVSGGHSLLPNFDQRLAHDFRSILPSEMPLYVRRPQGDVLTAPWRGMARWANTEAFGRAGTTRQEYEEMGGEYIKDHPFNRFSGRAT